MAREWQGDEILSLVRGYQPACVLTAAAELDLFAVMGNDRLTAAAIADRLDADPRATTVLLDALVALSLLEKNSEGFAVPGSIGSLLTADGADSVLAMTRHHMRCLRRWSQLAQVVKSGQPAAPTASIRGAEADEEAFIEAMNDVNREVAPGLVAGLAIKDFEHLLDIGGATGTWTMVWLDQNPQARATLFDLPHVIPLSERRLRAAGYGDRVRLVAGDFDVDPLPAGTDLAWLSAIVHQNGREENRQLFRRIHTALEPGGRLLIRDIVMEESRVAPVMGALFAINMLVATPGGGTFTLTDLADDLTDAGFVAAELIRADEGMHAVVQARKPAAK